ncbi:alpha/beta hydrolase-fold protein [Arenibacter sp. F20364]|uniref:alpha/beta hydrolase n=1 Tax=Arenibacter sp. F20364 TaxID=2926415 RepID=UPI001FF5B631|nr:alpha/beta hydrolase-fold protein [Arenibacter sp. F20364]MCK0188917.1 alpha/beta hydrolase-fold protein [Arenibacter sp. F20364]
MSSFRTIELSDMAYENDGLRFLTIKTKNLKGRGDICLFVPKNDENLRDLPIYILLHGVYGSSWSWSMKGGAHRTAARLIEDKSIKPAIIAMPSDGLWGDGSGYLSHQEKDFAQWIVSDVPKAIVENLVGASERSPLCIGGLSMGGYGALMLGARFPNKFKAISGHSSITKFEQMAAFVEESLASYEIGDSDKNVIDLIKKQEGQLPALRFDCGTSDDLLEANRTLHKELQALKIAHTYEEFEGGHEWPYWQEHVEKTLRFFDTQI